jgi:predicted RecB family nuclease
MRFYDNALLHAASDLNALLGCAHAVAMNLQKLRDPQSLPDKAEDNKSMVLIQDAGHAHEAEYLASLKASGDVVEIVADRDLNARAQATAKAMRDGAPVIYQAAFLGAPWHGFADFLRRVDLPSNLGNFSYEPVDTKLARTPSPKHVLQLGLYSDLIAGVQGARPHGMYIVLGDGKEVSFRTVEFRHTLDAAKARYLDFIERGAPVSRPEPCSACDLCGWRDVCADQWEAEDHLSRVAGMQKGQIQKLRSAGVRTVAELGALVPDTRIPKLAPTTFARLRAQAALQVARRTGEPVVELLPIEVGRGFARLPKSDPHDLFFDLEGDPLYPDGLEYLWGVHYRDGNAAAQFRFAWGHDRAEERAAFEQILDWFADHLARHPGAHIYHYAPYEVTVLRRLSTVFASREDAVDRLLRAEKFVDLYAIARAAIRTSEPDLSLKTLEIFFAEKRAEDVKRADQSIVHYHRWRETGDQALLDGILAYNKVDCENTEGLRKWLLTLRPDLPWWTKPNPPSALEKSEEAAEREARREALRQVVRRDATRLSNRGRELMAYLIDFHARAKKPEQWAVFDRCSREPDELIDDSECIGDVSPRGKDWLRPDKRSVIATYRFPDQDSKLREGKDVLHAPTMESLGTIVHLDRETGILEVRRGATIASPWPVAGSIIPAWPLDTKPLEAAVERVAEFLAMGENEVSRANAEPDMPAGKVRYQAAVDIIEREGPRMLAWEGGKLARAGESFIDAATSRALALNCSALFIQGPPGTGKTYTSANVILSLIAAGKRVGVSSNSHKAINNLLAKIEQVAAETGTILSGAKKVSRNGRL